MHHHRLVFSPGLLDDFGFAYRMDLSHNVEFAQAAPAHFFAGRGVQFILVSAIYRAHMSEPVF